VFSGGEAEVGPGVDERRHGDEFFGSMMRGLIDSVEGTAIGCSVSVVAGMGFIEKESDGLEALFPLAGSGDLSCGVSVSGWIAWVDQFCRCVVTVVVVDVDGGGLSVRIVAVDDTVALADFVNYCSVHHFSGGNFRIVLKARLIHSVIQITVRIQRIFNVTYTKGILIGQYRSRGLKCDLGRSPTEVKSPKRILSSNLGSFIGSARR